MANSILMCIVLEQDVKQVNIGLIVRYPHTFAHMFCVICGALREKIIPKSIFFLEHRLSRPYIMLVVSQFRSSVGLITQKNIVHSS